MRVERQFCDRCGAIYRIVKPLTACGLCGGLTLRLEVTDEEPAVPRSAVRPFRLVFDEEPEGETGEQLGLDLPGLPSLEDDHGDRHDAL